MIVDYFIEKDLSTSDFPSTTVVGKKHLVILLLGQAKIKLTTDFTFERTDNESERQLNIQSLSLI
jgi:hypothetical protein